jgi:hypothetical protein
LRWGIDREKADFICCYNRDDDEGKNYAWQEGITWEQELREKGIITYFDSVTGKALF